MIQKNNFKTDFLTEKFSSLLSATESMRTELKALLSYLFLAGENPETFILDQLKGFKGTPAEDIVLTKKDGARFLHALKEKIQRVLPDVTDKSRNITAAFSDKKTSVFSEIFVETDALAYPLTKEILSHFPGIKTAEISHYKDLFNISGQDFLAQKRSPSLILAVNKGRRLYPGARPCQSFGHEYFTYASQVKNCLYDCEYCFLRGMYPSGNIVIFVNLEDYFSDIDALLKEHPLYLSIAYDTDLLALEGFTGIIEQYAAFASKHPSLLLEIRTKCASKKVFNTLKNAADNIILAYTVSPDPVADCFEHGAGSFNARKEAVRLALNEGIRTRLCMDPMIAVRDWEKIYGEAIDLLFEDPVMKRLEDISVGTFRISASYIKKLKKTELTAISAYPYELSDGICCYPESLRNEMFAFAGDKIAAYYPADRIFFSDM